MGLNYSVESIMNLIGIETDSGKLPEFIDYIYKNVEGIIRGTPF